jgi:hypothetical protein
MADIDMFDTIFEEDDDEETEFVDDSVLYRVPDPVLIRGAGNITV